MRKSAAYNFIVIGLYIRFLRKIPVGLSTKLIKECVRDLKNSLSSCGFNVSLNGLDTLEKFSKKLPNEMPISSAQVSSLDKIMLSFEQIIRAEAVSQQVYVFEPKRFNLEYLIDKPEKIFAAGVYDKFSDIAKYDFEEGFKCIACARSTAAAFHILRGTEDIIKNLLYFKEIKRKRENKPMWDNMLKGVRAKARHKADNDLLDTLNYIRERYRNPTSHPSEIYDMDRVQDLLGLCLEVINKIANIKY